MATSSQISLDVKHRPLFAVRQLSEESAKSASKFLQENHEKHHILYGQSGFHNHIVHHLLSIYALGATPEVIEARYNENTSYQRPIAPEDKNVVKSMHDSKTFNACLGNENHYQDFLAFFQEEIEAKGWQNVLNEYVFNGDERADDMLIRMYAGFLHPIIHLGFGVEFEQPAIIAEALAQAAVHKTWMAPFLRGSENEAKQNGDPSKTLVQILEEMSTDEKLCSAPHWDDDNKIRDGILSRAPNEMIKYASQYVVTSELLEKKTAEMINFTVYFLAAAQNPRYIPKIDFFFMHCVNCSIFYPTFLSAPWLSEANKIRLLEYKARTDLAMYVSRRSPPLHLEEVTKYRPKHPSDNLDPIFARIVRHEDDGHAAKLIRALANGREICNAYENEKGFIIKNDMWLNLAHMVTDSVEAGGPRWVRGAGFDEAWEKVPEREAANL